MAAHRFVAVVGARALPKSWASQVGAVVGHFLERGWGIGSGGARGADQFALEAVLAAGLGWLWRRGTVRRAAWIHAAVAIAVLGTAAVIGDPWLGAALLFTFGLARGLPVFVVGTATGAVKHMRRLAPLVPRIERAGGALVLIG